MGKKLCLNVNSHDSELGWGEAGEQGVWGHSSSLWPVTGKFEFEADDKYFASTFCKKSTTVYLAVD